MTSVRAKAQPCLLVFLSNQKNASKLSPVKGPVPNPCCIKRSCRALKLVKFKQFQRSYHNS